MLSENDVLDRLGVASRRGRLPGFAHPSRNGTLFSVAAFGQPFDGEVRASAGRAGPGTRLSFEVRLLTRGPLAMAVLLGLTVWPGVYFMDQLMIQLLPGVRAAVPTWWWYLPLTALPAPWWWARMVRRSRRSAAAAARRTLERIAAEVDGRVVEA